MTEERLGFVGIVIEDRQSVPKVNEILSSFAAMIRRPHGRTQPVPGAVCDLPDRSGHQRSTGGA